MFIVIALVLESRLSALPSAKPQVPRSCLGLAQTAHTLAGYTESESEPPLHTRMASAASSKVTVRDIVTLPMSPAPLGAYAGNTSICASTPRDEIPATPVYPAATTTVNAMPSAVAGKRWNNMAIRYVTLSFSHLCMRGSILILTLMMCRNMSFAEPIAEFVGTMVLVMLGTAGNAQGVLFDNQNVSSSPAGVRIKAFLLPSQTQTFFTMLHTILNADTFCNIFLGMAKRRSRLGPRRQLRRLDRERD